MSIDRRRPAPTLRRRLVGLAVAGGALPMLLAGPAGAATPGRDLAIVSVRADDSTARTGQLVRITVVAVNHGRGQVDQAVTVANVTGLTAESAVCAYGVSPDGPNDCEYGAPPAGQRFTTMFSVRAGAPTRHLRTATLQVCTTDLDGRADPNPRNNCRSVTIRLVGRA
jgi:hypothetical protein